MTKKERPNCGHCKYFQIDGMFGLWCDKGLNWEEAEYCEYFERDMRGMTEQELFDELNNLSKKNRKLQFELKECEDNKLFSRRELEKENKMLKKENEELKKENNNLKKTLWGAEEDYLNEAYYDNPIRKEDKLKDLKEDFKRGYWND